jgi:hypothetical protein
MHSLLQHPNRLLLKPVSKFVCNNNLTLSFGYKVDMIILLRELLILSAEYRLWCFEHGVHPLHNIVDHFKVESMAVRTISQKARSNVILMHCRLEDLDRAQDSVGLRDTLLHEVVKLVL